MLSFLFSVSLFCFALSENDEETKIVGGFKAASHDKGDPKQLLTCESARHKGAETLTKGLYHVDDAHYNRSFAREYDRREES